MQKREVSDKKKVFYFALNPLLYSPGYYRFCLVLADTSHFEGITWIDQTAEPAELTEEVVAAACLASAAANPLQVETAGLFILQPRNWSIPSPAASAAEK